MVKKHILEGLQLLSKGLISSWVRQEFEIPTEKVKDMIAISLCPYHGVGKNGVHAGTYGKLVDSIEPTKWDNDTNTYYFNAKGRSGKIVPGCIWYRRITNELELASIEVLGNQSHVSSVMINSNGKGEFIIGFNSNKSIEGIQLLLWRILALMVFEEDLNHILKNGYYLSDNNPFSKIISL